MGKTSSHSRLEDYSKFFSLGLGQLDTTFDSSHFMFLPLGSGSGALQKKKKADGRETQQKKQATLARSLCPVTELFLWNS